MKFITTSSKLLVCKNLLTFIIDIFIISNQATAISPVTAGLKPLNALSTNLLFLNLFKKFATMTIIINEGSTIANVATIPPSIPPALNPAYVAIFIPIGPGVD